jgi:hypothetical protein
VDGHYLATIVNCLTGVPIPPFISLSGVKALIKAELGQGCQIHRGHLGGTDDPIKGIGAERFHTIRLPGASRGVGLKAGSDPLF